MSKMLTNLKLYIYNPFRIWIDCNCTVRVLWWHHFNLAEYLQKDCSLKIILHSFKPTKKTMKSAVFAATVSAAHGAFYTNHTDTLKEMWDNYKVEYRRSYYDEEDRTRFGIFIENLKIVDERNRLETNTAIHGINKFTDISQEEFRQRLYHRLSVLMIIILTYISLIGISLQSVLCRNQSAPLSLSLNQPYLTTPSLTGRVCIQLQWRTKDIVAVAGRFPLRSRSSPMRWESFSPSTSCRLNRSLSAPLQPLAAVVGGQRVHTIMSWRKVASLLKTCILTPATWEPLALAMMIHPRMLLVLRASPLFKENQTWQPTCNPLGHCLFVLMRTTGALTPEELWALAVSKLTTVCKLLVLPRDPMAIGKFVTAGAPGTNQITYFSKLIIF